MRLILCNTAPERPKVKQFPDDVFVFLCCEDFSVGPLGNWASPSTFRKSREAFWRDSSVFDLPDGGKLDYTAWMQVFPYHNLVELIESGTAPEDIPSYPDFEDLLPQASSIEVLCDGSVSSCVFLWYIAAALPALGVDLTKVTLCTLSDGLVRDRQRKFLTDTILGKDDRELAPKALPKTQWELLARYWRAATMLPTPVDPGLLASADDNALNAFSVLEKRFPDPETGLSNIQSRLLSAVTSEWRKSYIVVSDAMIEGANINDDICFDLLQDELEKMAKYEPPLVELSGADAMNNSKVRLTASGEAKQELLTKSLR